MDTPQTFHDHIKELRNRILWVVLSIGASAGLGYGFHARIINLLIHPLGSPVFYTSPSGSFNFVIKVSLVIGAFITLPVIIYQLVRFLEPAFPKRVSRSFMVKVIGSSFLLASAGIAFGYFYMIPMSLKFFAGFSSTQIKPLISASEYLTYILNSLITFAVVFQIPLLILFINWFKPIKPGKLLHYQRHVVVGSLGLAVLLPFTYDPISQFIFAIPIIVLFYLSAILLWIVDKRRPKERPNFVVATAQTATPISAPITPELPEELPKRQLLPKPMLTMDGFIRQNRAPSYAAALAAPQPTVSKVMPKPTPQVLTNTRRPTSLDGMITRAAPFSAMQ